MVKKPASIFLHIFFLIFLLSSSVQAFAECSDRRVKRLAKDGQTVASIAKTCDMSRREVTDILNESDDAGETRDSGNRQTASPGLPSGREITGCGCWGYTDGRPFQDQRCQSGMAMPSMCPIGCPMGGFAWRGICQ